MKQTNNKKVDILNNLLLNVESKELLTEKYSIVSPGIFTELNFLPALTEVIPEWVRLVGCKQHNIHDFTLDVHTMLVFLRAKQDNAFVNLDENKKLLLLYSTLLHDISKNADTVDPNHPEKGAVLASAILYRLGFDENFIYKVYKLIKHHQYLGLLAVGRVCLKDINPKEIFVNNEILNLAQILAKADIKSVKKNEAFWTEEKAVNFEKICDDIAKGL